jgi:dTDP-4-dehydro-6-deoxy-alpha-D-glucopyranose 2,3-dehydratase
MSAVQPLAAVAPPGFLASARCADGPFLDVDGARRWLRQRRRQQRYDVERISFAALRDWRFEEDSGDLVHASGRFFRVQGLRARCEFPARLEFEQPIINQPEVGVLGILAKRFDGVLHFLLQAKMEPGNVDLVQLSPTVQATRSNYTRVHGGARPRYLDFFLGRGAHRVLVDQLQSEQGLFFLRKRNRNMIVETEADVVVHEDFQWLTLGQIKELLRDRHTVNMDTRTVIAAIPLVSSAPEAAAAGCAPRREATTFADALVASTLASRGAQSTDAVLSWLTDIRSNAEVDAQPCALGAIQGWERDAHELRRRDGRYFKVFGIAVSSDSREVASWTQPMVQPVEPGVSAFVSKRIDGLLHFLVQARMEPGVWNLIELGPTVQWLRDTPLDGEGAPFMLREVLGGSAGVTRHRSTQCEEGGRFYRYTTEHIVTELDERDDRPVPATYTWVTLAQLNTLIRYGNHLNIEARSVLACLDVRAF